MRIHLSEAVRRKVPVGPAPRALYSRSRTFLNSWMLQQRLRAFEREVRMGMGTAPSPALAEDLRLAGGNCGWRTRAGFLVTMVDWFGRTSGSVVECGSGLSTLLLAAVAAHPGRHVLKLEHDPNRAERVRRAIPKRLQSALEIALAPLRTYGDFDWYSLKGLTPAAPIGLVVCDGPPGSTRGGRYGLGPVLGPMLAQGCVVLVDDTHRAADRSAVERWREELGARVLDELGTHCVIQVGSGQKAASAFRVAA
jgi:Methyltransferase domain